MTIRFLLKYLSRPLHFFGTVGMLSILSGFGCRLAGGGEAPPPLRSAGAAWTADDLRRRAVPGRTEYARGWVCWARCRFVTITNRTRRAPYSVDRVLRAQSEEHTVSE